MSSKRKNLISPEKLKATGEITSLPSGAHAPSPSTEVMKFNYVYDKQLGQRFKAWSHLNGYNAQDVIEKLVRDFMKDKSLDEIA